MALTDTAVRQTRARDRAYKLADGRGLTLLIQPNGSKWWRFRYRSPGAERMLSMGTYPDMPLAVALSAQAASLSFGRKPARAAKRTKRSRLNRLILRRFRSDILAWVTPSTLAAST